MAYRAIGATMKRPVPGAPNLRRHGRAIRTTLLIACGVAVLSLPAGRASAAVQGAETTSDPFESVNRVFFAVHGFLDVVILRPLAIGYKRIMPRPIRTGLHNAISNLSEPVVAANDILQGHGKKAARTLTRFVGDSTFGIGGLFDVATAAGLPHHGNDFGITLAHYGVKPGPYLFIPLLGPTTVRDGFGSLVDIGLNPLTYARYNGDTEVGAVSVVAGGLDLRAAQDKNLKALEASATDVYASLRSFYLQNRQSAITGGKINLDALPSFDDPGAPPAATPAPSAMDPAAPAPSVPSTPTQAPAPAPQT